MEQAINLKVQKQLILGQGKLLQLLFFQIVYMAKSRKSQIQEAKMSFLRMMDGLSLRDRVRSSDIRERNQLRWFGHLVRITPGCLSSGGVSSMLIWGKTKDMLERSYLSWLAWERLCIPLEELVELAGEMSVWISLLSCCPIAIRTGISGRRRNGQDPPLCSYVGE